MMSPLAKDLGRAGISSPRTSHNVSISSPRSRRLQPSRASPGLMKETNDDTSEKEQISRNSAKSAPAQLPQANLTDHYSMCLKLSAENKITLKNAFELHLIDFMGDMLFEQAVLSNVDFNFAASSIDAGTKIFTCRIDSLHTKVMKCMNAFTMKGMGEEAAEVEEDEGAVEDDSNELHEAELKKDKEKKAKKRKKKKTRFSKGDTKPITTNIVAISCRQIDPLFDKFMQMMKVTGSNNLLLSSLLILNDTHRPIFDSDDPMPTFCGGGGGGDDGNSTGNVVGNGCLLGCHYSGSREGGGEGGGEDGVKEGCEGELEHDVGCPVASMKNRKLLNIDKFKDMLLRCTDESKILCPTFRTFEFNNKDFSSLNNFALKKHRFDGSTGQPMSDEDDNFGGPEDDYEDAEFIRDISGVGANLFLVDKDKLLNSKDTSRIDFQQLNKTINSIREGDLSSLKAALFRGKDGVPCFTEDFMKMFNGPDLWKGKMAKTFHATAGHNKAPRPRKPKETTYLTFDNADDIVKDSEEESNDADVKKMKKKRKKLQPEVGTMEWHFQSTTLTHLKVEDSVQLLPEQDIILNERLYSAFVLKDIKLEIKQPSRRNTVEVPGYNYNNTNDKLNYCPPAINDDDNYDDDNVGGFEEGSGDDGANNNTLTNMNDANIPLIFGDDNDRGGEEEEDDEDILTGSRLLPEPGEVMPLKIDYAKIAKNVDVKVMKETMIKRMDKEMDKEKEKSLELSRLYRRVMEELPHKEADDFSVAMAVSCLLQIANEKSLNLENCENFDDVLISKNSQN